MFFKSLQFPKVSAKNIYYCGQKPRETDIAHMVSNFVSHALKKKRIFHGNAAAARGTKKLLARNLNLNICILIYFSLY